MTEAASESLAIRVDATHSVSGLWQRPSSVRCALALAPGAGAGITHAFMADMAGLLAERRIATLRYQFPYMEKGSKRPDPPALAHATVRAAVAEAAKACPGLPLIAGGKSFGGRMTSQAQGKAPLEGVKGLAFFGFPLHPAGKPSAERAAHLAEVKLPMLFLQGTRDTLAELSLLEPVIRGLGRNATLHRAEGADHSFHVLKSSGRNDREVLAEILGAFATWVDAVVG